MVHIAPLPVLTQVYYLLGSSFVSIALSLLGFFLWENGPLYSTVAHPIEGPSYGYTRASITGLILAMSFTTLGVVLLYEASQLFLRHAFHVSHAGREFARLKHSALGVHGCLGVVFIACGCIGFFDMSLEPMQCFVFFCIDPSVYPNTGTSKGHSFNICVGFMMLGTLVPLGVIMLLRLYRLWRLQRATAGMLKAQRTGSESGDTAQVPNPPSVLDAVACQPREGDAEVVGAPPPPKNSTEAPNPMKKTRSMRFYREPSFSKQLFAFLMVFAAIVLFALATFWLPNDPRRYTSGFLANYFQSGVHDYGSPGETPMYPELGNATFRTRGVAITDKLILKIYPSNCFFFAYLLAVALAIFVLKQSQKGRHWMQCRMKIWARFTYGEVVFLAATLVMCVLFFVYWQMDHNYKKTWSPTVNPEKMLWPAERWGRSLGQLAVLLLSLLMFPIGHHSVLVTVFGLSRDGMLWLHRLLGYLMLAATVAHIIAFLVSYHDYGQLWNNINYLPYIVGRKGVSKDYSMSTVTWTTYVLLVAMGIFALNAVRRRFYELFYYSHLIATYMTLPAVLMHASASWMYMLPGMTVFLVDQLARVMRRSATVHVHEARIISNDIVELSFYAPGRWDLTTLHPGHYVKVNVAELSALQWHPFTLANVVDGEPEESEGDARKRPRGTTLFVLYIKQQGSLTWTGRLYDMVLRQVPLSLAVEGPCGRPVDFTKYDDVVLVAGGIGATPCISIFGSLLRRRASGQGARVPNVRFVWSARSAGLVSAVLTSMRADLDANRVRSPLLATPPSAALSLPTIALHIYMTCSGGVGSLDMEGEDITPGETYWDDEEGDHLSELEVTVPREGEVKEVLASPKAVNRAWGSQVKLQDGRPPLNEELLAALADPTTGVVGGNVARKLIFVCGPEAMVREVIQIAAKLGVAVHTEEFLF